jgi:hypothetical protein
MTKRTGEKEQQRPIDGANHVAAVQAAAEQQASCNHQCPDLAWQRRCEKPDQRCGADRGFRQLPAIQEWQVRNRASVRRMRQLRSPCNRNGTIGYC